MNFFLISEQVWYPTNTQRGYNVAATSRCCSDVVCLLGKQFRGPSAVRVNMAYTYVIGERVVTHDIGLLTQCLLT